MSKKIGILWNISVRNWNQFEIWSIKNDSVLTKKMCLKLAFQQNLALIVIILHERKWTKWSWKAFYAQKVTICSINPTRHSFWMNFEWKYMCTWAKLNNNLRKVTSHVHNPTVVNGIVRNILPNGRESTVNWALNGSIYPG